MATLCGATAMKYYLPTLLKALGLETRVALMAGAVEMTLKIGFTVLEMFLIDRFGRRSCLIAGCAVMAVAMLVSMSGSRREVVLTMFRSTVRCPLPSRTMLAKSPMLFASSLSSSTP
jgi:MFS family permease